MTILFLITAVVILATAMMVVTARNLVHAALWLVASLFGVAMLYAMLDAGFMAVVQVVVYIGAIAILFIFAVMLTRRQMGETGPGLNKNWWVSVVVSILTFTGLLALFAEVSGGWAALASGGGLLPSASADLPPKFDAVGELGTALISPNAFVLPFEVASILLVAALVGAVYIAYNPRSGDNRK